MAQIIYTEVVRLAEQLTPEEQDALAMHLQEIAQRRQLTKDERKALFESMIVDLGTVSSDFSFRREDWYGDDGR